MSNALKKIAAEIRKEVVKMHRRGSNVGSAMSAADILAVLYFDVMNVESVEDPLRDRFVLSKGHAVSALYATLAQKGFLDPGMLSEYLVDGSPLMGHPCADSVPGIEVSTGSLGHGLPIAAGMAWVAKLDGQPYRVFVLMGDGEQQEGTVWEGAALAARLGLDNLVAIIDVNRLQGYDRTDTIMPVATLADKWTAFGWTTREVDGNDVERLRATLGRAPFAAGRPSVVVAHTIKGKGVAEMEDQLGWHYFSVAEEKVSPFCQELDEQE
jgi:transketolase